MNYSQSESIMCYSEKDLEDYANYMDMVREMVRECKYLKPKTKRNMCEGKTLMKINKDTWCLKSNKQTFEFISFDNYLKSVNRHKKIEQLLNDYI